MIETGVPPTPPPEVAATAQAQQLTTIVTTAGMNVLSFTGIPATWQHARLVIVGRDTSVLAASLIMKIRFNSDNVAANYSMSQNCGYLPGSLNNVNALGVTRLELLGYSQNKFFKSFFGIGGLMVGGGGPGTTIAMGMWKNVAPITQIDVLAVNGFVVGSIGTLELYG